jgi:hypothetical protein
MLRKLFLCCVLGSCVAVLVGCPKKKDDGADASEEAGPVAEVDAAPAAPAAPVAKNAPDVARFPAEKPLADDDAKILDLFTQAKTGCKSGANVGFVKPGTDPFKVAEFQDCILVTFTDPKDAAGTLMGWIPKTAFVASAPRDAGPKDGSVDAAVVVVVDAAVAAPAPLKCPAGQDVVVNVAGGAGVCRKKCSTDKDCKTPTPGACAPAHNAANKITKVCANEAP